jgi:hypothetical protein
MARGSAYVAVGAALLVAAEVGAETPRPWLALLAATILVGGGAAVARESITGGAITAREGGGAGEVVVAGDRVAWRLGLVLTAAIPLCLVAALELAGLDGFVPLLPGLLVATALVQRRRVVQSRRAERNGVVVCLPVPEPLLRRLAVTDGEGRTPGRRVARRLVRSPGQVRAPDRRQKAWLRALAGLLAVAVAAPVWSLGSTLARPSADPVSVRAVEWLRGHGGASVVSRTEAWWYAHHAPKKGGQLATPLTSTGQPVSNRTGLRPVPPLASPGLPGEGQWNVVSGSPDHPAVAVTQLRPDPVHTSLLAGLMRLDPSQLTFQLLAGTDQPGGTFPENGQVPAAERASLVAAFNSGFRQTEAGGGFYSEGRTTAPLVNGAASLVIRKDGSATVAEWGRDAKMGPDVKAARQNLALIVDGGAPVAGLESNVGNRWGRTLGNRLFVWRSGVGVTADGALVYAAGPGLSVPSLAQLLVAAGSTRAMELDINTDWVGAYTYQRSPSGPVGTKLLPSMYHDPTRYLHAQSRDFVAVLARP